MAVDTLADNRSDGGKQRCRAAKDNRIDIACLHDDYVAWDCRNRVYSGLYLRCGSARAQGGRPLSARGDLECGGGVDGHDLNPRCVVVKHELHIEARRHVMALLSLERAVNRCAVAGQGKRDRW